MINNYLNSLSSKSVWAFTKQTTNYEMAFNATKLFANYCENEDTTSVNIEDYFTQNSAQYGIDTDRHRMLVISQLFGLITKTPFYTRGSQYNKERPTEIFDMIRDCQIGTPIYNKVKTEQLLKLKIHAIIDTANNNEGYNVLPVLFIYKVLKTLKDKYQIESISIDHLYTYVMTCKSYDEVDDAVEYIKNNAPISAKLVKAFKDFSRVLTVIKNNISLFIVEQNTISINPTFDDYFYNNFVTKFDFDALHEQLLRDVDYSYFLYNYQGFEINLIDEPSYRVSTHKSADLQLDEDTDKKEKEYQEKVDKVKESNVNDDVANDAYKVAPVVAIKTQVAMKFERNPLLGKLAIKNAYYTCEYNRQHKTFTSQSTQKPYMEAHHLIPIVFQKAMWDKYHINIDCVENLVSLCPTCHKAFHYGTVDVKREYVEMLFKQIEHKYKAIGFDISLVEIKRCYGVE
ncbi:MAG TPA: HNH endonuclease [Bacteroidales bacterium]|nr:HNH endonuclease [Bacteroidales bacterium]HPL05515.1 HNH endonuclease [Bacteroidales bacterium]